MVIDTSAVVAILQDEPASASLVEKLVESATRYISTANLLESAMVMQARFGDAGERELDVLLQRLRVESVPGDGTACGNRTIGLSAIWERSPSRGTELR